MRQADVYKKNVDRKEISAKEKYQQNIEEGKIGNQAGILTGGGESHAQAKMPLGKYVSQMEMKDPEARRRLREMLEFQMNEK